MDLNNTTKDYEQILNGLVYQQDMRKPPDKTRKSQFKIGWKNAVNNKKYTTKTLKILTWNNLGYRFGLRLGKTLETTIDEVYEFLSQQYLRKTKKLKVENSCNIYADEVNVTEKFSEGSVKQVLVNFYERDPKARKKCLEHYGLNCIICGFNFAKTYGKLGEGFIHVHHLRQISEIGEKYEVDPIKDLRPVCPNCHAMIHRSSPPYSIQEIKEKLLENK